MRNKILTWTQASIVRSKLEKDTRKLMRANATHTAFKVQTPQLERHSEFGLKAHL